MDKIYYNAEFTIVDAVGADASHGLVKMGHASSYQQFQEIGNVRLMKKIPNAESLLRKSPWASRGWTLQESYLSRRRIIFTEYGVLYLCNSISAVEWKTCPLNECYLDKYDDHEFLEFLPELPTKAIQYDSFKDEDPHIGLISGIHMIEGYTRRHLSNENDTFNACRGIMNFLRNSAIHTVWGIPVYTPETPESIGTIALGWKHDEPAKRVPGFPSWSFVGWKGSIYNLCKINLPVERSKAYLGGVTPHEHSYDLTEIGKINHGNIEDEKCTRRYLYLTRYIIDLPLTRSSWTADDFVTDGWTTSGLTIADREEKNRAGAQTAVYASLKLTQSINMLVRVSIDVEDLSGRTRGIFMISSYDPESMWKEPGWVGTRERDMHMLVLKEHGGFYERIGVAFIHPLATEKGISTFFTVFTDQEGRVISEVSTEDFKDPLCRKEAKEETIILG